MGASRTDTGFGFSLIEGGPLFRLERAAHLLGGRHDTFRRALVFAVLGWLPALVLAAIGGMTPGKLIPLHLRFLIAIPILLAAEPFIDRRVRAALKTFVDTDLVVGDDAQRFSTIVRAAQHLRESGAALVTIVAVAFGLSVVGYSGLTAPFSSAVAAADAWVAYVSIPLFRIMLLLWIWRWTVWTILLFRISRLDLRLVPTHPDLAGGIGFLELPALSFLSMHVAVGIALAGDLVIDMTSKRAGLSSLLEPIAGFGVVVGAMVMGPLLLFTRRLFAAKRRGQLEFAALATRPNREFGERWFGKRAAGGPVDPTGDPAIASLAHLGKNFSFVNQMRAVPFGRQSLTIVIAVCAAPLIPSVLARIPTHEIIKEIGGMLL